MNYDMNSKKFKDSEKAERNANKGKDIEKKNARSKMEKFENMMHGKSKSKGRKGDMC
jgi:hypothetical protein